MIFISDKQIVGNLKKIGFTNIDSKVFAALNDAAFNFVKKSLERAVKKAILKGGRVVLPAEYYGVASHNYVMEPSGTNMSVTDQLIRPAFQAELNGGAEAPVFKLGLQTTKNMCREVVATSHIEVIVRESAIKKIHAKLVSKLSELVLNFKRQAKGSTDLTHKMITDALALKKYADFA